MYQVASTKHCLYRSRTSNKHWMNLIRGWCWSLASDGRRCPSSKYKLMCMMSMGANTTDVRGGKLHTLNMRMPFCLRLLLLLLDALTGIESFRHSAPTPFSSWQCASMSVDEAIWSIWWKSQAFVVSLITPNNYRPINELCAKGCDYLKNDNSI